MNPQRSFSITFPNAPEIWISEADMFFAAMVGLRRRIESRFHGRFEGDGPIDGWSADIEGAIGEFAYCKFRGRPWNAGVNTFKDPDAGEKTQVRFTNSPNNKLIIRQSDNPEHAYVLVTGPLPKCRFVGWLYGHEAKKLGSFGSKNGREECWWVDQSSLRPFTKAASFGTAGSRK